MEKLAINGGVPVRQQPFPQWPVYGNREKQLLDEVLKSRIWGFPGIENLVGPKVTSSPPTRGGAFWQFR